MKENQNNLQSTKQLTLELCRTSYKLFALECETPFDPFLYGKLGIPNIQESFTEPDAVKRMRAVMCPSFNTTPLGQNPRADHLDPVNYRLTPLTAQDVKRPVFYRPGVGDEMIKFGVTDVESQINAVFHANSNNKVTGSFGFFPSQVQDNSLCVIYGETGHLKKQGNPTPIGFVLKKGNAAYIVFRGSRSANGKNALIRGVSGGGNADWVTDMKYLDKSTVEYQIENREALTINYSKGFWETWDSTKKSVTTALNHLFGNTGPSKVYWTGHSLGSAIAQVGYLDTTLNLAPFTCEHYLIGYSSPCTISKGSSERMSALAKNSERVSNIIANAQHHRIPTDMVTELDVDGSINKKILQSVINNVKKLKSLIPFLDPKMRKRTWVGKMYDHSLPQCEFPDSHELYKVREAMGFGEGSDGYWPLTTMSHILNDPLGEDAQEYRISISDEDAAHIRIYKNNWIKCIKNLQTKGKLLNLILVKHVKAGPDDANVVVESVAKVEHCGYASQSAKQAILLNNLIYNIHGQRRIGY